MKRNVPKSIDSTGKADVTSALTDFIGSAPDGTTIVFPQRGTYRMDRTLEITDKTDLVLAGHASRFVTTATDDGNRAQLRVVGGRRFTAQNLTIVGSSTVGGTPGAFVDTLQWQHAVDLRGVAGVTLDRIIASDLYGDCFYAGSGYGASSGKVCSDVAITACEGWRNGRQGIALVHAERVAVDTTTLGQIALMTFNIEPNPGCHVDAVTFRDNIMGTGPRQQALGVVGHGPVSNVTMTRTTLKGKTLRVWLQSADGLRLTNFTITDNTSDTPLTSGYPIDATAVDGLVVTGNHQVTSGPFAQLADCTGVNVQAQSA